MKLLKNFLIAGLAVSTLTVGSAKMSAAEHVQPGAAPAIKPAVKPYPLKTCLVSGEKLGGDMGKPYVFVHEGQEIKLCCQSCLKDFKKDPAKYLKKLAEAQKAGKDAQPNTPAGNHSEHQH